MHDSPSTVIRRMKDTSIKVAMDLAKEGQVDGVVSARELRGRPWPWPWSS